MRFEAFVFAVLFGLRFFKLSYPHLGQTVSDVVLIAILWLSLALLTKGMHDRGRLIWYRPGLLALQICLSIASVALAA